MALIPTRTVLVPPLREQRMALGDRRGDVDDRAVPAAGVVAQPVERLTLGDVVALHEDALRTLDERPALERGLEPLDLLDFYLNKKAHATELDDDERRA